MVSEFYKDVQKLSRTSRHFKDLAKGINVKLECLLPLIKQIEDENVQLSLSNQYVELFKMEIMEGLELIQNCSEVSTWNIPKKLKFTGELRQLDDSLKKWLDIITLDEVKDGKETLKLVRVMIKIMVLAMFFLASGAPIIIFFVSKKKYKR